MFRSLAQLFTGGLIIHSKKNYIRILILPYFQILNNLCAAGYRLAQTISTLEQWGLNEAAFMSASAQAQLHQQQPTANTSGASFQSGMPLPTQFMNAWDDLARYLETQEVFLFKITSH